MMAPGGSPGPEEPADGSGGGSSSGGAGSGTGGTGAEAEAELELGVDGARALFLDGLPQTILPHDQKLLIAGSPSGDFWVTRLDDAGETDATFGTAGQTVVAFPGRETPI